jgi:hypothetical protein
MKLDLKTLEKALEYAKKSGTTQVEISISQLHGKLEIKFYDLSEFQNTILLAPSGSELFNEIIKMERF